MEYKTLSEITRAADAAPAVFTRTERLERWASALERRGADQLSTLWQTEHVARRQRPSIRADNSPLSVAFDDPMLRVAGLRNDSFGEAMRFFELSERQVHWVVCHCHFGSSMSADEAARRVRALFPIRLPKFLTGLLNRVVRAR